MSKRLLFTKEAVTDIRQAVLFYGKISPELANRFEIELSQKLHELVATPEHFQERYRSIRISFLRVFPFGIHFTVQGEIIKVFRILHTKRFFSSS